MSSEVKTGDLVKQAMMKDMTVPDFLVNETVEGMEHVTTADIQMPRIVISQSTSPELSPEKPNYMEDLRVGQLFNTLTGQIYGKGPIVFTVLRADPPRWVEFIPREQGGGVKDPHVPFGDPRTEFQIDGKPPIATKFYDFIIMVMEGSKTPYEMVALSFKSTGLRVARQLNGLLQSRMKPICSGLYTLTAAPTQNAKGSFYIPQVRNAVPGWVTKEVYLGLTKPAFESLKNKVIDIERISDQHVDDPDGGDTTFDAQKYEREAAEQGM